MSNSPRPEGTPWISPYIIVSDVDRAVHFYEKAFGFQVKQIIAGEDRTSWHAEILYNDQLIMFGKAGAYGGRTQAPKDSGVESPINLYLYCKSVDDFYQKA